MRNYFILNGVDSRDFGVYISGQGTFSAPQKAYTFYNVPGRNGAILGSENRLENINVSYEAFIYTDFDNQIARFRTFLLSLNGYVQLTDSYHPDEFRMAVYTGPFEPTVERTNDAGKFVITFSCKPQRYLLSGDASYYWVPGGSQGISGEELIIYIPKLNTSVFSWSYNRHERGSTGLYKAGSIVWEIFNLDNNTLYKSITRITSSYRITEGSANLITGALTINSSVVYLRNDIASSNWSKYANYIYRAAVSGWSELINVFWSRTAPNFVPICSNMTELQNASRGILLDGGYLYIKNSNTSTLQAFLDWLDASYNFSVDRSFSTPQSLSIGTYTPDYPEANMMKIAGVNGTGEAFTMQYYDSDTMSNPTEFPSSPMIRAYGNGSFVMDGVTITITNATTYTDIDCDLMDCYEGSTNRNNDVSFSTYDFPLLRPGDNSVNIISGITALEITPRWWRV